MGYIKSTKYGVKLNQIQNKEIKDLILFFDVCFLKPLHKCPGSVQDYITLPLTSYTYIQKQESSTLLILVGFKTTLIGSINVQSA